MTSAEFRILLKDVFESYKTMNDRDYHSINELLYVLRYDNNFNNLQHVNVSIQKTDGDWICIPSLDAFVNVRTFSIWFNDNSVEFTTDEFENDGELVKFDNITVYEREEE